MCKYMQRKRIMNKRIRWKDEELNFVKENYPLKGARFCAGALNRSVGAIRHLTMRKNIYYSTWSEKQIEILKNTYTREGLGKCSLLLNKNGATIIRKLKELNIPLNTRYFDENETNFLIQN